MAPHVLPALSGFIGGFWIHSCSQQPLKTFKKWSAMEQLMQLKKYLAWREIASCSEQLLSELILVEGNLKFNNSCLEASCGLYVYSCPR